MDNILNALYLMFITVHQSGVSTYSFVRVLAKMHGLTIPRLKGQGVVLDWMWWLAILHTILSFRSLSDTNFSILEILNAT